MRFNVLTAQGVQFQKELTPRRLYLIGYAGRDTAAQQAHIRELWEQYGIPAPAKTPSIFICDACLLTQRSDLHFVGGDTSGEAECVLFLQEGELFVGVGSDHTDRALESESVPKAKQVCPKPVGGTLWAFDGVRSHWDELQLSAWIGDGETETLYQQGSLAELLPPGQVLSELFARAGAIDPAAIYCGTVPVIGSIRGAKRFRCELYDPVLGRRLTCAYRAETEEAT